MYTWQIALIDTIHIENEHIQRLRFRQDISTLSTCFKRLKKMVNQLLSVDPTNKNYCIASSILSNCSKIDLTQTQPLSDQADADHDLKRMHLLVFEHLQYQINLAVSMLDW